MDNVIMVSMIRRGKSNNVVLDGLFEIGFLYYVQGDKDVNEYLFSRIHIFTYYVVYSFQNNYTILYT